MQPAKPEIRRIRKDELSIIRDLPPPDWNLNLQEVYDQHFNKDYFYPVITLVDSEIVGTGIAVVNDNSTWLGTIIVKENFRNRGIGRAITNNLINYSKSKDIDKIILTASKLGLPVYRKIGFEHDINYLFFKTDNPVKIDIVSKKISKITENEYIRILELDFAITGERRGTLLSGFLKTGFKYKDKIVEGYFLPDFGTGLIIADSATAGIELLKFRLSGDSSAICIPETNSFAIGYLKSIGYYQFLFSPRMYLNRNVNWDSGKVYLRGCGYLG